MRYLCGHAGGLDDSLQYHDDLEVFAACGQVIGTHVPQRTGLGDTVLNNQWPHEEQSTFVVTFLIAVTKHQLSLVDRQNFALASHSLTY